MTTSFHNCPSAVGEGFEAVSLTINSANSLQQSPIQGEAESEVVSTNSGPMDAESAVVVDAWHTLPDAIKAGIRAIVRTASRVGRGMDE